MIRPSPSLSLRTAESYGLQNIRAMCLQWLLDNLMTQHSEELLIQQCPHLGAQGHPTQTILLCTTSSSVPRGWTGRQDATIPPPTALYPFTAKQTPGDSGTAVRELPHGAG